MLAEISDKYRFIAEELKSFCSDDIRGIEAMLSNAWRDEGALVYRVYLDELQVSVKDLESDILNLADLMSVQADLLLREDIPQ